MSSPSIDERLQRLKENLESLLSDQKEIKEIQRNNLDELRILFGLSPKQAEIWLKKEPNYKQTKVYMNPEADEDFTEPVMIRLNSFLQRVHVN